MTHIKPGTYLISNTVDSRMNVPINSPGSTVEDLENDLAALECSLRAVTFCRSGPDAVFADGAGAYEPEAVIAWLKEKIAETENTLGEHDPLRELLLEAVETWTEFDGEDEVSGGDLCEWFGQWRPRVKAALGLK